MTRIDNLTAYHLAIDLAKKAGFVFDHASQKTESCYYYHPARGKGYLLRLSTHRSKKSPIGFSNVVARASFTATDLNCFEASVLKKMIQTIGLYFLADKPEQKYRGKKGTWETHLAVGGTLGSGDAGTSNQASGC